MRLSFEEVVVVVVVMVMVVGEEDECAPVHTYLIKCIFIRPIISVGNIFLEVLLSLPSSAWRGLITIQDQTNRTSSITTLITVR